MFYTNRAVSVKKTEINPGRLQTPVLYFTPCHAGPTAPLQGIPTGAVSLGQILLLLWGEVFAHLDFIDGKVRRAVGFM